MYRVRRAVTAGTPWRAAAPTCDDAATGTRGHAIAVRRVNVDRGARTRQRTVRDMRPALSAPQSARPVMTQRHDTLIVAHRRPPWLMVSVAIPNGTCEQPPRAR